VASRRIAFGLVDLFHALVGGGARRRRNRLGRRFRLFAEQLEPRQLLSATLYVSQLSGTTSTWTDTSQGDAQNVSLFQPGDNVTRTVGGTAVSGLWQQTAFSTVSQALAQAGSGATIDVLSGTYGGPTTVNVPGVTIQADPGVPGVGVSFQGAGGLGVFDVTAANVSVSGLTISASSAAAITVEAAASGFSLTDDTITASGTGVLVNGGSAAITGNQIYDNGTGISFTGGGSGSVSGNGFSGATANGTDLFVDSSAGSVSIGDGNAFAGATDYIQNLSSQAFDLSGDATTTFGGVNAAMTAVTSANLGSFYGIEDKLLDGLDNPASGYVRIAGGYDFVAQSSEAAAAGAIQRAIDAAASGDVIEIQAGTYLAAADYADQAAGVQGLNVDKPLTIRGANSGIDPNTALRGPETIIEPDRSEPDPWSATAFTVLGINSSNVTIDGLTIDGSNGTTPGFVHAAGAPVLGGHVIDASEGVSSYMDVGNVTLQNNIIENTAYTGADFQNGAGYGGAATSGNSITDNLVQNVSDAYGYGAGVFLYDNFYANVSNNVMSGVAVGVQTGNFYQAQPEGLGTANISHNQISAAGIGIFFNLMYGDASAFNVASNEITAVYSAADAPWQGVLLTSIGDAVSATFQDNTIDGSAAYTSPSTPSSGYEAWDTSTTGDVVISGGAVSGVAYGVWVNTYEGQGSDAGATRVTVTGVNLSAGQIGVYVEDSLLNIAHPAVSAIVTGGTQITAGGSGTGILVSGANASAAVSGSSIGTAAVGIDVEGGTAAIDSNVFSANGTDVKIAADSDVTSLTDNVFSGTQYIENLAPGNLDASSDAFSVDSGGGPVSGNALTVAQGYAVEDRVTDAIDAAGLGFVRIQSGSLFVTPNSFLAPASDDSGAIQRAVDAASSGDTVYVQSGTYAENLTISKPLTLVGGGQVGSNATIILPGFAGAVGGSTFADGASNLILVQSSDVTIEDLVLDGNNPALAGADGAQVVDGVNVDAQNGIVTDYRLGVPFSNFVVHDTTVQNIDFRGIYASDGGTFDIYNNTLSNVEGDPSSVAIFNYGGSGTFQDNTVSYANDAISANWSAGTQFIGNSISYSASGIHSDNAQAPDLIQDNAVSSGTAGSYGIWIFTPYANVTVSDNTVTDNDLGLGVFGGQGGVVTFTGNTVDYTAPRAGSMGVEVSTTTWYYGEMPVSAVFSGTNAISNADYGMWIEQNPTATNATTTVSLAGVALTDDGTGIEINGGTVTFGSGNTITGGGTGLVIDNQTSFYDPSYPTLVTDPTVSAIAGNTLNDLAFSGQSGNYITLADGALDGQTLDASGASFEGTAGSALSTTSWPTAYAVEDQITDAIDASGLGLVRIQAGNLYVTPNSYVAPATDASGAVARAAAVAAPGDTINVDTGLSFSGLTSATIDYGAATTALGGSITADSWVPVPVGSVAIDVNGQTDEAAIAADGSFSDAFPTATLPASATPYTITYSYSGATVGGLQYNYSTGSGNAISDTSQTLTVNPSGTNYSADVTTLTTTSTPTVNTGDPVSFTVQIDNTGTGAAIGVRFSDPLPAGLNTDLAWSIASQSTAGAFSINGAGPGGQSLAFNPSTLAAGASDTVTLIVTSTANDASPSTLTGSLVNAATVTADNEIAADQNQSSTAAITINAPNLTITQTGNGTVKSTDTVNFTITVRNAGPGMAYNVNLSDPLPDSAHLTWISDLGTINWGMLSDSVAVLAPGASLVIHVTAATAGGYSAALNDTATVTAGNSNQGPLSALATDVVLAPDVTVAQTADQSTITAGQVAGFTITLRNIGQGSATGVTLSDPLPAGPGQDIVWMIDATTGNPAAFAISGTAGNQVLALHPAGISLAPGAGLSVHITAASHLDDVTSSSTTHCPIPPTQGSSGGLVNIATVDATNGLQSQQAQASINILRVAPVLSVSDAGGQYVGNPFPAVATVAGVVPGVDTTPSSSLQGTALTLLYYLDSAWGCVVDGSVVIFAGPVPPVTVSAASPTTAGTYTVVAYFAGSADYAPAQSAPATFTITPAAPTVSVTDAGGTFQGAPFAANATVAGLSGVPAASLEGVSPTLAYYTGSTATGPARNGAPAATGTYTVVASFGRSLDYAAAQSKPVTFTVNRATPAVTVTDAGGAYTGKPFPATARVTGVSGVAAASLEAVSPTLTYYVGSSASGTAWNVAPTAAGTYTVVASFGGSTDYRSAQSTSVTFSIARAVPVLSVSDTGGTFKGSAFPAKVTIAGASGTPAVSLEGVTPTWAYYAGSTPIGTPLGGAPTAVGTYTVLASFQGSLDYAAAQTSPLTFTITQATPRVTVADAGGTYNGKPFPATARVSGVSGSAAASLETVSPTLAYYVGPAISGTGATVAPTAAGVYTVVASFAGSTDYGPARSGALLFQINQARPTIKVTAASGTYTGNPFSATATVAGVVAGVDNLPRSSLEGTGLTFAYYAGSSAAGTPLAGAPVATGTYTVVASFAGSTDYAAAQSGPVTFNIKAAAAAPAVKTSVAPAAVHDAAILSLFGD
jgi:uncharacterized repeat protein (TIGR01451 family)